MRRAIVLAVALLIANTTAAQNAAVDILHYRIEIEVPVTGEEIAGRTEISVRPVAVPLPSLVLDFGGFTIDEVTIDGQPAKYTRDGEKLRILTGWKRDVFRTAIRYHGAPTDGLFIQANKHGRRGAFADNWPNRAHYWFPGVDHPSDKATVEFFVTVPPGYETIANGKRIATTTLSGGATQTHWSEATPIPVHCMVFGAAGFAIVDAGKAAGTDVSYYFDPEDKEKGTLQFGRARKMVELYSTLVGPYPYEKLALVQSSTRFGGMENASAIFLDEKRIGESISLENLVAHEIAHQWFGDSVTQTQWPDVWLSEGFATYFAALFFERADGREAFMKRMLDARETYLKANRQKARAIHEDTTELRTLLSAFTYQKAAWVLHMLRGIMGDGPFFAAIRDYYAGYRDSNASTAELRLIMERHAGQPLAWFFRQWIFETGHPQFALDWQWQQGKVDVTIEQKQGGAVFRVPLTVEVRGASQVSREKVVVDERRETIRISVEEEPVSVVLDPEDWVLKEMVQ